MMVHTTLKVIVNNIRTRDVALVIISAVLVYLLRAREQFDLKPVWRKHIDARTAYANGRFPAQHEKLPIPVVTDLDDDGQEEIVLVSGLLELQICRIPHKELPVNRQLPELNDCNSMEMVLDDSHRPVVVETGYISPPQSQNTRRSQVIVVLFDDWTVHCYDSNLQLLWSNVYMDLNNNNRQFIMQSAGVLITSHSINQGNNGTVIVGANFVHAHQKSRIFKTMHDGTSLNGHLNDHAHQHQDSENDEKLRHFSTFALNGVDGRVLWHHLPGDFEQKQHDLASAYHWKLALKSGHWHAGEVHWTKYSDNLLRYLPHMWHDLVDTRFDVADLRRLHVVGSHVRSESGDSLPTLAPLSDIIGLYDEHITGRPYGGMRPHSRHEHVDWPNAVVVHHSAGIQVLSFQTGRPLTHIPLVGHGGSSTFADINGDKSVEEVRADFNLKCNVDVATILPRPRALFTGVLCESPFWWGGVSLSNIFQTTDVVSEDTPIAVAPVVVSRVAQSHGILKHLLGRSLPSEQKGFDSVFLTSAGRITSFSPSGDPNWQTVAPTTWSQIAMQLELNSNFASTEKGSIYVNSFRPSMKAFSLQIYAKKTAVLISGWDTVAVVDLRDGHLAGQHSLPCQPIADPVIGDFNHDGWSDFIILCSDGFVGFEIHQSSTFLYTTGVAVAVGLLILLLMWCFVVPDSDDE